MTLAVGGCSMLEYKPLSKETLKNSQGHVIGYRERLCDCTAGGEELDRVVLFTPRYSERGTVVAYEERVKGGAVLHDLKGKRIGNRWVDLRSRGSNARSGGLTIVFVPKEAERIVLAQVTIEDIKQHLRISN
ncbi:MAG TPA: hypothetical protein VGX52_12295 [Burkholderiales bacterium]|nr:hypothetical protein [Burkholderiales bacterium]